MRPNVEDEFLHGQSASPTESVSLTQASIESSNDLGFQAEANDKASIANVVLPGDKMRMVFIVIFPELWQSIQPVWKCSRRDERFIVSVAVLSYYDLVNVCY